jgi:hypothetical protein
VSEAIKGWAIPLGTHRPDWRRFEFTSFPVTGLGEREQRPAVLIVGDLGFTAHDVGSLRMAADLARDTQSARWYRDLADRIEVLLADELHER